MKTNDFIDILEMRSCRENCDQVRKGEGGSGERRETETERETRTDRDTGRETDRDRETSLV